MSLTQTTASVAISATDTKITFAAVTGLSADMPIRVDGEMMKVSHTYVTAANPVDVLRGQQGTYAVAHPVSSKLLYGAGTDSDWGAQGAGQVVPFPIFGKTTQVLGYSASGAITLPDPGSDMVANLNGTSVLAMTVADPVKASEGSVLTIVANGAAAHTVTFASGLSGGGSSYDKITFNGTNPISLRFISVNGLWQEFVQTPMAGTVTAVTGTLD